MQGAPTAHRHSWRVALLVLALAALTASLAPRMRPPRGEIALSPMPLPVKPVPSAPFPEDQPIASPAAEPPRTGAPPSVVFEEPPAVSPVPKIEFSEGLLPWEQQIARVLASNSSPRSKALVLFSLLSSLPAEATDTATHAAVEVLRDPDYAAIAEPVLVNPQTDGAIQSVLFADLMQRPDAIALPALLKIARLPTHPYAAYAQDNLALLLGHNWASDWPAWEAALRQRLAGRSPQ